MHSEAFVQNGIIFPSEIWKGTSLSAELPYIRFLFLYVFPLYSCFVLNAIAIFHFSLHLLLFSVCKTGVSAGSRRSFPVYIGYPPVLR